MMLFARAITPILLAISIFSVACVEDKDYGEANNLRPEVNSNVNTNEPVEEKPAEDSKQKLETLIKLPFDPEEADFRVDSMSKKAGDERVPGPEDYMLTVVLKYNDDDAEKLVELLEKEKTFDIEIGAETWFPAELKAKADAEGDQKIKGKGFAATSFAKPPYNNGTILRVPETNFFVLRMSTS